MNRSRTGEGYAYYRDRSGGDITVYEHQLMALLNHDPEDVFDPKNDVHHLAPGPDSNIPSLFEIRDRDEHRSNGGDKHGPGWVGNLPRDLVGDTAISIPVVFGRECNACGHHPLTRMGNRDVCPGCDRLLGED